MKSMATSAAPATSRHDQKTAAIIEGARKTFLARGFDAASMDQIALEAGVSKRTVYNRFRSKEELFGAAIEITCQSFLPVDIDDIEQSLPLEQFLLEVARQFLHGVLHPDALSLRRIAAFEADRKPEIGRAYLDNGPKRLVEQCAPILRRLAAKGELEVDDVDAAVWRLGVLVTEPLHMQMLLGETPDDLDAAIEDQTASGVAAFLRLHQKSKS